MRLALSSPGIEDSWTLAPLKDHLPDLPPAKIVVHLLIEALSLLEPCREDPRGEFDPTVAPQPPDGPEYLQR